MYLIKGKQKGSLVIDLRVYTFLAAMIASKLRRRSKLASVILARNNRACAMTASCLSPSACKQISFSRTPPQTKFIKEHLMTMNEEVPSIGTAQALESSPQKQLQLADLIASLSL